MARTACWASGRSLRLVHTRPATTDAVRITVAAIVPEWKGMPKLLTKVISSVLNKRNTIGMIKAKTIANTPIPVALATINPLRVGLGFFLK